MKAEWDNTRGYGTPPPKNPDSQPCYDETVITEK